MYKFNKPKTYHNNVKVNTGTELIEILFITNNVHVAHAHIILVLKSKLLLANFLTFNIFSYSFNIIYCFTNYSH